MNRGYRPWTGLIELFRFFYISKQNNIMNHKMGRGFGSWTGADRTLEMYCISIQVVVVGCCSCRLLLSVVVAVGCCWSQINHVVGHRWVKHHSDLGVSFSQSVKLA